MPAYTSNFPELLLPTLRVVYGDSYGEYPEEYSDIYDFDTSNRAYEEDHGLSGFGFIPIKPEGSSIVYDEMYNAYTTRYTQFVFALGFIVTREMWEDDQYKKMKNRSKALARSVRQTIEVLGANVLNRAFNSAYKGGDGKEFLATDHPLAGGGTFRNELSIPADLDITSYEQALIDIQMELVDDRGLKVRALPKKLIVHPINDFQAQQILKSARLPGTANNDFNPAQGTMPGGHKVLHWLTDPDAFFIQTDVPNGLVWIWHEGGKPAFGQDNDWETENGKYKTRFRCAQGFTDPRSFFGSPGQ